MPWTIATLAVSLLATEPSVGEWSPSVEMISSIETRVVMPKSAASLSRYSRYYSGVTLDGRRVVIGVFVLDPLTSPAVRIVPQDQLPSWRDGGCSVVKIVVPEAAVAASVRASCGGEA